MNYLGFKNKELSTTVKGLNQLLADYHVYYQNLRNFHWNVEGQNFFALHIQFEELYQDARTKIDEIAERILTLRERPTSTMSEYLKHSNVKESGKVIQDTRMVEILLENHKVLIESMREVIGAADNAGDEGTIDMISGFLGFIEKKSWMLDAFMARKAAEPLNNGTS
ncbi:MAG: DNA starvation/stationary phase protection protein [Lewinellaceae bacterium]|nr:DNA starvation/stationary phase protection protein [Saprospiraceae bacterium]MCB9340327.1 DNA starvation/stationary phase protection protein [Lewinellaceae bacterium]